MSSKPFSLLLLLLLSAAILLRCAAGAGAAGSGAARGVRNARRGPGGDAFCDARAPVRERARDLVARLTRAEKVRLLGDGAAAVPRWGSQSTSGGRRRSTASPTRVPGSASAAPSPAPPASPRSSPPPPPSTPPSGSSSARDPRWGRGQETPGEDPIVAARYAAAYVRGLQQPYGGSPGHSRLKLAACCKHYTAYDLDNWKGHNRYQFNAIVSKQDLEDTFNVPFKACVEEGQVASVMCSYNQINGVPSCADPNLLSGTVRGLYIVSDCDSVGVLYGAQRFTHTPEDAVAVTLKAGLDLDCGPFLSKHAESAVQQGKISDADIDAALIHTIMVQMRLGMFDGEPSKQPFGNLGPRDVCTQAHQDLALQAARQGIVLLDNDRGILPLSRDRVRTVAVVGPNSDATLTMIGNYAGNPCRFTSPLQGIGRYVNTIHQKGCTNVACVGNQPIEAAAGAARVADATIMIVGLDQSAETEALDRVSLLLPGRQQELVSKVAAAARGPVVLVLMCGGPVDVTFAKSDLKIGAILWAGYPGQAGGAAIADVIFGAYNPSGKLPVTWYPEEYVDTVPMTDMAMRPDPARGYPGRSYRFYTGPVVYPFGHGLSYTRFAQSLAEPPPALLAVPVRGRPRLNSTGPGWAAVRVDRARCEGLVIPVHVDVANVGGRDGAHTVLVYSSPPQRGGSAPGKQLVAFEKVHVAAGGRVRVEVGVDVCRDMSFADVSGVRRIPIGDHSIQIGDLLHSVSLTVQAHV
ncbi:putative beta-D-xylosidase 2 [Ananas comosus]|uniref:Putative beta-D-xylosidase 2 n=1 Tax=Ananas comosus TaxID=4615 RepID=A0A199VE02_ANACO|nr:putative beta-D-xylosidase 2 [Ananas comosus]